MKTFHVGVKPDAPFSTCQLAGVGFQKHSSAWGAGGAEVHKPGLHMEAEDDLPEKVKKAAATRVVRYRKDRSGADLSATIVDVRQKGFRKQNGDVALGTFVYCVEVAAMPEVDPTPAPLVTPEPVAEPEPVNDRNGGPREGTHKERRAAKKAALVEETFPKGGDSDGEDL